MSVRAVLRDFVKLHANEIGSNFRQIIQTKLCQMSEGICTRHGYILPGSIKVISTSLGRMDGASLNGAAVYEAEYEAVLYNPSIGSRVVARVVNINRFGILAHSHMTSNSSTERINVEEGLLAASKPRDVLEIIVAKQGGAALASDVDVEGVRIGDMVTVEILGKRFELNDTKISVVGKIVGISQQLDARGANKPAQVFTDDDEVHGDDSTQSGDEDDGENDGVNSQDEDDNEEGDEDDDDDDEDDDDEVSDQQSASDVDEDDDDDDSLLDVNDFSDGSVDADDSTDEDGSDSN